MPETIHPQWLDLEDFVEAFEAAQVRDGNANLEDYLPDSEHPLYRDVLLELVRIDLEYGWQRAQPQPLEAYQQRFPELFQDRDGLRTVAFEEYRLRQQAGENPSPAEYQRRFGGLLADWSDLLHRTDNQANGVTRQRASERQAWDTPGRSISLKAPSWDAAPGSAYRLVKAGRKLPEIGAQFLDFQLIAELGRGAFGKVYLARQRGLANRYVALKIAPDMEVEAQALAQLQHTHIVPIYSVHEALSLQVVCMPYLGSVTLGDLLRTWHERGALPVSGKEFVETLQSCQHRKLDKQRSDPSRAAASGETPEHPEVAARLPASRTGATAQDKLETRSYVQAILWLAVRMADGLAHAHDRGILHRDLKPSNILLTDDGEPMLLDFHLSHDSKRPSGVCAAHVGGTLPYMAPEQLDAFQGGRRPVDSRSDVYAFGVILYELLTGQRPFPMRQGSVDDILPSLIADRLQAPPEVQHLNKAISPAVGAIVHRCLAREPDKRYQTAHQVREDLQRQLNNLPLKHTPEPSLGERLGKWRRRHPRLMSATSVASLAAVVLGVFGGLLLVRDRQQAEVEAMNSFMRLREEMKAIQFFLNSPNAEREHLEEGITLCRQTVDRYHVLDNPSWLEARLVRFLSAQEQASLRDDLGEVLLAWARAILAQADASAASTAHQEQIGFALRLNALAETCYSPSASPRALWLQRGRLMRRAGQDEEGRRLEEEAAKIPLRSARERYLLLSDALDCGKYHEALGLLRATSGRDRENGLSWLLLGNFHKALAQRADAAACYDVAIALAPDSPWGYYHRGIIRLEQHQYRQACSDLDEALRLKPNHGSALINRALAKYGLGQGQEAIADLTRALEEGTPYTRVYFMRSRMRAKMGDLEGARQDHEEGLRRPPHDENDWIARGEARVPQDPQRAFADFEKALELNPRSRAALQDQASVLSENLGRAKESLRFFDRLVELYPDYVLARAGRGVVLARLGQRAAALRDAKEVLARDSQPAFLYQVAGIYALTSRSHPEDRGEAFRLLSAALRSGYGLDLLDKDTDLDPLRVEPEFHRLVEAARALRTGGATPSTAPGRNAQGIAPD